uniref:Uncharacterized protein n=1 Tax=Leersia perrieri TaxID=77586 RepID=A0A0D9XPD6_9ORYZ
MAGDGEEGGWWRKRIILPLNSRCVTQQQRGRTLRDERLKGVLLKIHTIIEEAKAWQITN